MQDLILITLMALSAFYGYKLKVTSKDPQVQFYLVLLVVGIVLLGNWMKVPYILVAGLIGFFVGVARSSGKDKSTQENCTDSKNEDKELIIDIKQEAEKIVKVECNNGTYYLKQLTGKIRSAKENAYSSVSTTKVETYRGHKHVDTSYNYKKSKETRWMDLVIELTNGQLVDLKIPGCTNVPFQLDRPLSLFLASENGENFYPLKTYFYDDQETWYLDSQVEQKLHSLRTIINSIFTFVFMLAGGFLGYLIGDEQNSFWQGLLFGFVIMLIPSIISYFLLFREPNKAIDTLKETSRKITKSIEDAMTNTNSVF
ncbi:hypothetical protein [Colwellia sp. RSH04]|uniref:hypothetical protein n=1 Tax=Colwellia sp. RSH04 TaxID=2305464 RepID=UPI000E57474F|nr:hypothetical protein [Colwellia sp. RSH04]RHW76464.1 hypothetical protein D1094_09140 [Colwellia sp. RSH04]